MVASPNAGYFINNIGSDTGKVLKAFYDGLNLAPMPRRPEATSPWR
jgi:hypothetical protein